jgi:hypothetical protein
MFVAAKVKVVQYVGYYVGGKLLIYADHLMTLL